MIINKLPHILPFVIYCYFNSYSYHYHIHLPKTESLCGKIEPFIGL